MVFKALRESYPEIHLAGVVHRRSRVLLEHNPHVNQVFLFHKGPLAFRRLQRELIAAGPWDAILQLSGNDPEPRCLSYLVDPDVTVSVPNMTRLSWLCGHQVEPPDWHDTHSVEQTLRIAHYVGANTQKPHLVYEVNEEERARLAERLRPLLLAARPRLVLQLGGRPSASWRDWPVVRYAQLLRLIHAHQLPSEIFILGDEDQEERRRELDAFFAGEAKPYHNMVGKLSLTESAALLASARALVSTDTGILHHGFAVGTRVVALLHCNNPVDRRGPYLYGQRHREVQLERPKNYRTPADASMADIDAQTVFLQLREIWHE